MARCEKNEMQINMPWDYKMMNSMIFLYQTRKCPIFKRHGQCKYGDTCFDSHDEITRRRPRKISTSPTTYTWNYDTIKCHYGYPNRSENCRYGKKCKNYHSSTEFRYHPNEYKMKPCTDPQFKMTGYCSRGPLCWQYHNQSDQRDPNQYCPANLIETGMDKTQPPPQHFTHWLKNLPSTSHRPSKLRNNKPIPTKVVTQEQVDREIRNAEPCEHELDNQQVQKTQIVADDECKSENPRDSKTQQAHNRWLKHIAKWFVIFKTKPCPKGSACPKGVNCMGYHSVNDRRRVSRIDGVEMYKPEPCPHIFDFWNTKKFYYNKRCPDGEQCRYAHNYYELGYHQKNYKTQRCPYLQATLMTDAYEIKECPFHRNEQWFRQYFGHGAIEKIKGNIISHVDGLRTCLDFCAFYHNTYDRRYDDQDIEYVSNKKAKRHLPPIPSYFQRDIKKNRIKEIERGMDKISLDQKASEAEEFKNDLFDDW